MKFRKLLAFAFALVAISSQAQAIPDVPADTAIRVGKLANGLTYYVRYNNYPEHHVNFYIAQRVGSIQEEESQRGLAHFLEAYGIHHSSNVYKSDVRCRRNSWSPSPRLHLPVHDILLHHRS